MQSSLQHNSRLGIAYILLATMLFSFMDAFVKLAGEGLSVMETLFFRSIIMTLLVAGAIIKNKEAMILKPGGKIWLIVRSLSGAIAMMAVFHNISQMPLGVAISFIKSMPIYAVFLAWIFLREKMTLVIIISTLIGMGGILVISDPFTESVSGFNIFMGVVSGLGAAIAMTALRSSKQYFSSNFIILIFGLTTTIMSGAFLIFPYEIESISSFWVWPDSKQWFWIVGMGATGTIAQVFLTKAYLTAPSGVISPFTYTEIIFSTILGILLGDVIIRLHQITGMALIIISGLMIALPLFLKEYKRAK